MKKSELTKLKEIWKKIKTTYLDKIKSEQFCKDSVLLPLLAGLVLVVILAAAIAGIRNISTGGYGSMESRAASASDISGEETTAEQESTETEPEKRTGFYTEDGVLYYYNEDGSPYLGWLLQDSDWYYFTDQGAVTGYQTIDEYGREDECYFEEDGRLVMDAETPDGRMADSDGYLLDPNEEAAIREAWSEFEMEAGKAVTPGALSGIHISGEPAEFYMLSIAGESSGGQIIIGDRGRAYGLCQFDYRYDLVNFMRWAYERHPSLWQEFAEYTEKKAGDVSLVENAGIVQAFVSARERDYEAAISDELEFMRMTYWDHFAARLNAAGYRLSERHIAVSAAFFSVNVNCSSQAGLFLEHLSPEMTDAELICEIYKIRNTILAEQNVGRVKKGTTIRYQMAEPRMALDLLHGYTTIDSVKNYGGGVQWNGDLFVNAVLTSAVQGMSLEWEEALLATPADAEMETGQSEEDAAGQEETSGADAEHDGAASAGTAAEETAEEQKAQSNIVIAGRMHAKEETGYSAAESADDGNADTANEE